VAEKEIGVGGDPAGGGAAQAERRRDEVWLGEENLGPAFIGWRRK
jgi:hypothetical protein